MEFITSFSLISLNLHNLKINDSKSIPSDFFLRKKKIAVMECHPKILSSLLKNLENGIEELSFELKNESDDLKFDRLKEIDSLKYVTITIAIEELSRYNAFLKLIKLIPEAKQFYWHINVTLLKSWKEKLHGLSSLAYDRFNHYLKTEMHDLVLEFEHVNFNIQEY